MIDPKWKLPKGCGVWSSRNKEWETAEEVYAAMVDRLIRALAERIEALEKERWTIP